MITTTKNHSIKFHFNNYIISLYTPIYGDRLTGKFPKVEVAVLELTEFEDETHQTFITRRTVREVLNRHIEDNVCMVNLEELMRLMNWARNQKEELY